MTTLNELIEAHVKVMAETGDHKAAMKAVVHRMFWDLVTAEMQGRRNGKLAMIGEMADSSEAVAHRLIEQILTP